MLGKPAIMVLYDQRENPRYLSAAGHGGTYCLPALFQLLVGLLHRSDQLLPRPPIRPHQSPVGLALGGVEVAAGEPVGDEEEGEVVIVHRCAGGLAGAPLAGAPGADNQAGAGKKAARWRVGADLGCVLNALRRFVDRKSSWVTLALDRLLGCRTRPTNY